ncbi:MAG: RNA polymerase sigma factor [bacterium]|nr:RNA polymerase sigma factor [bacterium]
MKVAAMEHNDWPLNRADKIEAATRLFPIWVRNTRDDLYATLFRIVRNEGDAEDLLQDTYMRALARIDSYRGDGAPGAWLRSIAVRLALNHLRARKIRRWLPIHSNSNNDFTGESEIQIPDKGPSPSDLVLLAERKQQLESVLRTMPAKAQVAFSLRCLEDRSYDEIAELLGCSEATARSLVSRTSSRLEKVTRERGWHDE